jgi:hypothetical protein
MRRRCFLLNNLLCNLLNTVLLLLLLLRDRPPCLRLVMLHRHLQHMMLLERSTHLRRLARLLRQIDRNPGFRVLEMRLHDLNKRLGRLVLRGLDMALALHVVHGSLAGMLLVVQRDRH